MTVIDIRGMIVPNDWADELRLIGWEVTAPKDVQLPADGSPLTVQINSVGGVVMAGAEIYSRLRDYAGQVTVDVLSMAASAASLIAMAGDTIRMSPAAMMMIHNVSSTVSGDYHAMTHEVEVLKAYNQTIANAYRLRTGMDEAQTLAMMDKESWIPPQRAIQLGLADEIIGDPASVLSAQPSEEPDDAQAGAAALARARLNLIKLRGETR